MSAKDFPFEITPVEDEIHEELLQYYKGQFFRKVRVGPKRYLLPVSYEPQAASIYNLPLRPDDTFVVSYPRSGTTWTQELVWLIENDLDFETAKKISLHDRYLYLELSALFGDTFTVELECLDHEATKRGITMKSVDLAESTPSPRFIKSHLPLSLLPPNLLDSTKVVYVARDPRDVLISSFHVAKSNAYSYLVGDLDTYFDLFLRDTVFCTPVIEHVKEAWQKRNHPNMCFIFYEDLQKDFVGTSGRVAKFFGKQYSREQLEKLADYLHFDNFKNNQAIDPTGYKSAGIFKKDISFVRKGKAGAWRETLSEAQAQRAAQWIEESLRDSDLQYPQV